MAEFEFILKPKLRGEHMLRGVEVPGVRHTLLVTAEMCSFRVLSLACMLGNVLHKRFVVIKGFPVSAKINLQPNYLRATKF